MYRGLVESLVVICLALLGLFDAWRLSGVVREEGTFHDVIGPDRYLGAISIGLLICGIWNLGLRLKGKKAIEGHRKKEGENSHITMVTLVTVILIIYTVVLPGLGYLVATLLFFPVIFFLFGVRPWFKSLSIGLLVAVLFYGIFEHFAEVPLPKGILEVLF